MKFTYALSTVLVLLPAFTNAIALPAEVGGAEIQRGSNTIVGRKAGAELQRDGNSTVDRRQFGNGRGRGRNRFNFGGNQGNNNGQGNNNNQGNNNGKGNNNNNGGNNNNNNNNNNGGNNNNNGQNGNQGNNNQNPQESLSLLPELVAPGLAQNGQDPPVAGQVASLTTKNNFINFCAGQTITNGQQIAAGSCNPVPMGDIVAQDKMPSSKFTFPKNFSTIPANKAFRATIAVQNMATGFFTNAQKTYYSAPQQVNQQGILIAHSHLVIQKMNDFAAPEVLDPLNFAFFKGLNDPAVNGVLGADVTNGLAPGKYRMASIHANANHAPAIVAVAQHGFVDDMVYFTVA